METFRIVPSSAVDWEALQAVFGRRGQAAACQCQRMRWPGRVWWDMPRAERADWLRMQAGCGVPGAVAGGLVAYRGDEPVGWCAVAPRPVFRRLYQAQVTIPWAGRDEDREDAGVWAATCFVVRAGFRRRGVAGSLALAVPGFARAGGARAVEGYPMIVQEGAEIAWGEMHVGSVGMFRRAGFRQVGNPVPRRVVMRVDFAGDG